MTQKLGYGKWEELKLEVRKAWQFRFDWYLKSRTPQELNRRVDILIRLIEKETQESDDKEKESKKRKLTEVVNGD
jgi:SWI/SNF-related matrix-associated actin-dependent regulator of chromatin subfamily A member 5